MKSPSRSILHLFALALVASGLAACAKGVPEAADLPDPAFDIPEAIGGAEDAPPPKLEDPALAELGDPCAILYAEVDFAGAQLPIAPDDAALLDGAVSSVVVAPSCTLDSDTGAALEAGYHPEVDLAFADVRCACADSTGLTAYVGSEDPDGRSANHLPLYDMTPVDLEALGWSTRAWTVHFVVESAIVTMVGEAVGQVAEPSIAIVDPRFDEDGDGVLDLGFELYRSVPARGYPVILSDRVSVAEASVVEPAPDVAFSGCEAGECAEADGDDPEGLSGG